MRGLPDVRKRLARYGAVRPDDRGQVLLADPGTVVRYLSAVAPEQGFHPVLDESLTGAMSGGVPVHVPQEPGSADAVRSLVFALAHQERRLQELERRLQELSNRGGVPTPALSTLASAEREFERTNWEQLRREYAGRWVAIHRDRVVGDGDDMGAAVARAREAGVRDPYVTFVEEPDGNGPLRV